MRRPGDASECPMVADPAGGRLQRAVTSRLWVPAWVALAVLVQAMLLAVVPLAVLALARRATARPFVPELAAALAAVHPGLAYASATVYPVSLTAAALAVGIWLAAEVARRRGIGLAALAGLALGVAGAATPYFAPLPALIAFVIYRRAGALAAVVLASLGLLPAAA